MSGNNPMQSSMGRSMGRSRMEQSFGGSSTVRRAGASLRSKAGNRGAAHGKADATGPRKLVPDPAHPNLTVYHDGRDVTPLSLVKVAVGAVLLSSTGDTGTSQAVSMSGELAKSGGLATSMQESGMMVAGQMSLRDGEGSFSDMLTGGSQPHGVGSEPVTTWSAAGRRVDEPADDDEGFAPLSDAALAASVTLYLTETATFFWLDIEGDAVGKEVQAEHAATVAANERYLSVKQSRAASSDAYSERGAQTLSYEPKIKETMTAPALTSSMTSQAHAHLIEDAYAASGGGDRRNAQAVAAVAALSAIAIGPSGGPGSGASASSVGGGGANGSNQASLASFGPTGGTERSAVGGDATSSTSMVSTTNPQQGTFTSSYSLAVGPHAAGTDGDALRARLDAKLAALLSSDALSNAAHTVERMVAQNELQAKHRIYRDVVLGPTGRIAHGAGVAGTATGAQGGAGASPASGRKQRAGGKGGKGEGAAAGANGSSGVPASLEELWQFGCEQTRGRNVAALAWNPVATDVLAAAYGQFEFDAQKPGLVALWALQTPHHPLRLWRMPSGATSLAFSRLQPHLLAIGLYSGMVGVYDVRSVEGKSVSESHPISGKHNEPVWQLSWVEKLGGAGGDENLISVSTDGRVTQWALKKGLERTDLMRLKRLPGVAGSALGRSFAHVLERGRADDDGGDKKGGEGARTASLVEVPSAEGGIISRRAAGLTVDFSPVDPSIYICGTEDGSILKCSISYSEQHLEVYSGHRGPVYRLAYSPFAPHLFLSCSADWTAKVWSTDGDKREPLHSFQSTMHQVNDIAWSPLSATAFAAVTADGRIDLWDLESSTLDPAATAHCGTPLSSVAFARVDPVVVAGSKDGQVHVFRMHGPAASARVRALSAEEQSERLLATIAPSSLAEIG